MDATPQIAQAPQIAQIPQVPPGIEKTHSIRGPLRYQISTSSPQLEAGTKFSIYTRITNPYDVPVKITSVTTLLPVEFIDIALLERGQEKQRISGLIRVVQGSNAQDNGIFGKFLARPSPPAPRLSTQPVNSTQDADIVSGSDELSIMQLIRTSDDPEEAKKGVLKKLNDALKETTQVSDSSTELQPGNSIIQVFTLKTNRSIFFPPNVYQSSVRIEYEIDSCENIDVADYQLNIRAPLKAMIFGALVGSFFGFILKDLTSNRTIVSLSNTRGVIDYLLSLVTAMMMAGIVVVAFARKKDAQPILSVEDFWGGVFVGFLAGYSGKSFLDNALGVSHGANPPGAGINLGSNSVPIIPPK